MRRRRRIAVGGPCRLERLLEDKDPAVRKQAGAALRAIASRRYDEFSARHPSHDF